MCRVAAPACPSATTGVPGAGDIWVTLSGQADTRGRPWSPWEIWGCIPSKAQPPDPISCCSPPGSARGTPGPWSVHSHPGQGQSARPAPSQLLPVTPLGKLGAATAADTLQTPFYCFSPQFSVRANLAVSPFPSLGNSPGDTKPLGRARKGLGGCWSHRNFSHFKF